jgi:DNA polymerase I
MILLIDCHAVGHRAHHVLRNLTYDGGDIGVIYGFFSQVLTIAEQYKIDRLVFCWEGRPPSKRKALFPDYKKQSRERTPEEQAEMEQVFAQLSALRDQVLPKIGFENQLQFDGYEADDVIAKTIIDHESDTFLMVSGDADLYQLLHRRNCHGQHLLHTGRLYQAKHVQRDHGVPARDWAAVKSLAGCQSDGVPGVQGVGIQTAVKFLNSGLDPDSTRYKTIVRSKEQIRLCYRLVALPFPGLPTIQLRPDTVSFESLMETFDDLGFTSFTKGKGRERWSRFAEGWDYKEGGR